MFRQHPYLCSCLRCHVVRDWVLWLVRDRRQVARIIRGGDRSSIKHPARGSAVESLPRAGLVSPVPGGTDEQ